MAEGPEPPDPPDFTATPFWSGFWIAAGVTMVVVILVCAIIALVTRIEHQAGGTVLILSAGKEATGPFEDLVEANMHLRALARSGAAARVPDSGVVA